MQRRSIIRYKEESSLYFPTLRGVRQYIGSLIFVYKVKSKIGFEVLLGGGGRFMKSLVVTFSVPKSTYNWPLKR